MFKKLLICSDQSDASNLLFTCAGDLKSIGAEEAILVHVFDNVPLGFNEIFTGDTQAIFEKDYPAIKEVLNKLEKQKVLLEEAGLKTTIEAVNGIPARAIIELADKHKVSAIITGSHGKGIMKRATLGSVSTEVLTRARVPVFLIKAKLNKSDEVVLSRQKLLNHILYLTDFSTTADKALNHVEQIVQYSKIPVTIVHIQDTAQLYRDLSKVPGFDPKMLAEVEAQNYRKVRTDLQEIKKRLELAGSSRVNFDYPNGRPIDVVMDIIKKNEDLSLVVMGSQGKGFVKELFMGSLSLQVTRYSPIPVLIIPARV